MRLVHSFSAVRCTPETLAVHVYTFTLSAVYAKQNGFDIILHTDSIGAHYLQHAPYDEIIVDLGTPPEDKRIFAWCKFIAMANEPADSIHVDGDVFIKRPIQDLLSLKEHDILCQNLEKIGIFPYQESCWDKESYVWRDCKYPSWMPRKFNEMYNCGIIAFKDKKVRDEYFRLYHNMMDDFKINGRSTDCVPELVSEQKLLYDFAEHKNLKVKCLLDLHELNSSANKIGYQHLLGSAKHKSLDKTKMYLERLNKNVYDNTVEVLKDMSTLKQG